MSTVEEKRKNITKIQQKRLHDHINIEALQFLKSIEPKKIGISDVKLCKSRSQCACAV